MIDIRFRCRHCGAEQAFIAENVPANTQVDCSSCGGALGAWSQIAARAAEKPTGEEHV